MPYPLLKPMRRSVLGEVPGSDELKPVFTVVVDPRGIYIKESRARTWYGPLTFGYLHTLGGRLEAEKRRRERAEKRPHVIKRGRGKLTRGV